MPADARPQSLYFYIGGYGGPCHELRLDGDVLIYHGSPRLGAIDTPQLQPERLTPSPRKWANFLAHVATADVRGWDREYANRLGICDGTYWRLELHTGQFDIRCRGDNAYPPDAAWNRLLRGLYNLTGHRIR